MNLLICICIGSIDSSRVTLLWRLVFRYSDTYQEPNLSLCVQTQIVIAVYTQTQRWTLVVHTQTNAKPNVCWQQWHESLSLLQNLKASLGILLFMFCLLRLATVSWVNVTAVYGHAVSQVVGRWPVTVDVKVWFQAFECGICGGQSDTWTGFSLSTSVFPCQYHSTSAPHSFIPISLML
jgi:hypothetical protein